MKYKNFAVFILTHGRPNNVLTYHQIKKQGYTGKIFFILDDQDKTIDQYIKNFGKENIIIFSKKEILKTFDEFDNNKEKKSIVYARNASFDIAKNLNLGYFLQLDDDYTNFRCLDTIKKERRTVKSLDKVFDIFLEYLENNEKILSLCFLQGGDLIGGFKNGYLRRNKYPFQKRKVMNSFFCKTDRPFKFNGRINEDVNTYVLNGSRGDLFLTIPNIQLTQKQTQQNKGGMTELYLNNGTYVKSFFSVICHPSSVKAVYQDQMKRVHHYINWENTLPKILKEENKK
jgi:hypothetical protein